MKLKLIIAGYGFVGKAVFNALKDKHSLVIIDPMYSKEEIKNHHDADGIIVCVDTPTGENGIINANNVANVIDQVPVFMPVLIKSTVTPAIVEGFGVLYENHSICYSPEFLRARSANQDFLNQKYVIIGGEDPEAFWNELFLKTLPNCKLVFNCSAKEACVIKYSANSFLALKTSFFNQVFDICEKENLDFDIVRHILSMDTRIGTDHTLVPGPDGERGWGGACFPKDTEAFVQWTTSIGAPATLVSDAIKYNRQIRKNT